MPLGEVATRPAREEDFEFLYQLHRAAFRESVLETWGWDEEWQQAYFTEWFDADSRQVIELEGQPIGCLAARDGGNHLVLEYLALLPSVQNRGLGTRLVREVLDQARSRSIPVQLNVLAVSPARSLYERLGFTIVGIDRVRYQMEWTPGREAARSLPSPR